MLWCRASAAVANSRNTLGISAILEQTPEHAFRCAVRVHIRRHLCSTHGVLHLLGKLTSTAEALLGSHEGCFLTLLLQALCLVPRCKALGSIRRPRAVMGTLHCSV